MLPSQLTHAKTRRYGSKRGRGRRRRRRLIGVTVLGLLAAATAWVLRDSWWPASTGPEVATRSGVRGPSQPPPAAAVPAERREAPADERAAPPPVLEPTDDAGRDANVSLAGDPQRESVDDDLIANATPATTAQHAPGPTPEPTGATDPQPAPVETWSGEAITNPRTVSAGGSSDRAREMFERGMQHSADGRHVEGRRLLSDALWTGELGTDDAQAVRDQLSALNEEMVFSRAVVPGDPFTVTYKIESGDSLATITKKLGLQTNWRLLQRINGIEQAHRIKAGQRIKAITGPFHAVIDKSAYRLDLYLGELPTEQENSAESPVYVCSFPVGLGEFDSTPTGWFQIRPQSKLVNPRWTNPRTGEEFEADDPKNPIGERWLGLEGLRGGPNQDLEGYGIHGTIEPESIGRQQSMGCVRMLNEDVEIVYEVLIEARSRVVIVDSY
ncbi:MAG: L,D-transpeptidase family protein [Planctomycetota bacterium]|jgi:hypothetical protein